MNALVRFIAAHNLVPICISFICFRFFNTLGGEAVDYFLAFGISFFCWILYYADKIRDNRGHSFDKKDRHFLSASDKIIQTGIGLILLILTMTNFHPLVFRQLSLFLVILAISIVYLFLVNTGLKTVKEIFSSLIIAASVCFIPLNFYHASTDYFLIFLFFLMIYSNMLVLVLSDEAYDRKHQFNSISYSVPSEKLILLLLFILLVLISGQFIITAFKFRIFIIIYCLWYFVLIIFRKRISGNLMHILADLAFATPLFLT